VSKENDFKGLTNIPVELVKVNSPEGVNLYGTDEIDDIVHLLYSAFEAYEKAIESNGIGLDDLVLMGSVVMNIIDALNGVNTAIAEALDLTDNEIAALVDLSANFVLGDRAQKYRQIVKEFLMKFQTVGVFKR